jgi:MFS transporter, FSR family, fosmidomycin resistance protein
VPPVAHKHRLPEAAPTHFPVLGALSTAHFLNDMMQSLLLAIYPLLKGEFTLSFVQLGLITLAYQVTASLLQPLIGMYTDRHPQPHAVSAGMGSTAAGLFVLASAHGYEGVLVAAALIGTGSAIFHPESSRIARYASGGRHGLAQSIFQIGGNCGSAVGPLVAAVIILPAGRWSAAWFGLAAMIALALMWQVGGWFGREHVAAHQRHGHPAAHHAGLPPRLVARSIAVLIVLMFSKFFYLASLNSYYTFYLMARFHLSAGSAQFYLFAFLAAAAAGTMVGGHLGDRIGRKRIIWVSILGVVPFSLVLPFANLTWTCLLAVVIGFVIASAFSAIVVYAQELMPNRVGLVSGLFFGLAFGFGGIGAAVLGALADRAGIEAVYRFCAYVPLLGAAAFLLPELGSPASRIARREEPAPAEQILELR